MVAFEPHVTCHGAMAAPVRSCDYIMREMLKTNLQERFGHGPDPNIQVALPITLRARKSFGFHFHPFNLQAKRKTRKRENY